MPNVWIVIGNRFIPKEQLKDYADYLVGLGRYNVWNCDCEAFFSKHSPRGTPKYNIPKQYKHLFRPPIEGRISAVGESKLVEGPDFAPRYITPVTVNVGQNKGVKEGMILRIIIGDHVKREVEITKVSENSSSGVINDIIWQEEKGFVPTYYDVEAETEKPLPPIRVGTKVTTKIFP